MLVEIAVQSVEDARVAQECGADRLELCAALGPTGGITPSIGTIGRCVGLGLPVHVLVRPRGGAFVHTRSELEVMADDVAAAMDAGAAGVVIGVARRDGHLDEAGMAFLVDAARGAHVTLHRVCDLGAEAPEAVIATCRRLGIDRVLTSGGAQRVGHGLDRLSAMVDAAGDDVAVLAGGGLQVEDLAALHGIGVQEVHASAKIVCASGPVGPGGGSAAVERTDRGAVRRLVEAAGKVCA